MDFLGLINLRALPDMYNPLILRRISAQKEEFSAIKAQQVPHFASRRFLHLLAAKGARGELARGRAYYGIRN